MTLLFLWRYAGEGLRKDAARSHTPHRKCPTATPRGQGLQVQNFPLSSAILRHLMRTSPFSSSISHFGTRSQYRGSAPQTRALGKLFSETSNACNYVAEVASGILSSQITLDVWITPALRYLSASVHLQAGA